MNKTFDTIAGCLFLVVGAFFVWGSMGISRSSYGSTVGPNVFPLGLGCILMLLAITVITQARRSGGAAKQKGARDYRRFGFLLLATVVYIAVFESLGYVISTFLYLVFVFQVMERRRVFVSIGIAAFFSCFIYIVYVSVFQGTLPPLPDWMGILGY